MIIKIFKVFFSTPLPHLRFLILGEKILHFVK